MNAVVNSLGQSYMNQMVENTIHAKIYDKALFKYDEVLSVWLMRMLL